VSDLGAHGRHTRPTFIFDYQKVSYIFFSWLTIFTFVVVGSYIKF